MTEFKIGQKVLVSAFEGIVTYSDSSTTPSITVHDGDNNYMVIHKSHVTRVLPYKDGQTYMDADDELLTFSAANGGQWGRYSEVFELGYAMRPLREVALGDEIEE